MEYYFAAMAVAFIILVKIVYEVFCTASCRKTKPSLFMPGYELFYSDRTKGATILHSERYGLQGKPDLIYKSKGGSMMIPVELKSGSAGDAENPHEGDLMQLAAYFAIIEDVYSIKPRKGLLVYKDYMFIIKNNRRLRRRLLGILTEMRDMLATGDGTAEPSFVKCKHCICRGTVCEYSE